MNPLINTVIQIPEYIEHESANSLVQVMAFMGRAAVINTGLHKLFITFMKKVFTRNHFGHNNGTDDMYARHKAINAVNCTRREESRYPHGEL